MNPENDPTRSMPSAHEAERAVLSLAFQNANAVITQLPWLTVDHFHHPAHACLWKEFQKLTSDNRPVDLVSVLESLKDSGTLNAVGGPGELAEIFSLGAAPSSLEDFSRRLKEKYCRRGGLSSLWNATDALWDESTDYQEALAAAQAALFELQRTDTLHRAFEPSKPIVFRSLDRIQDMFKRRGHTTRGMGFGFTDLDRMTMGFPAGNVVVIGGRASMGKSALMMNFAENLALGCGHYPEFKQEGQTVAVITLEMSKDEMVDRIILGRAKIGASTIRMGIVSRESISKITAVGQEVAAASDKLQFLDTSCLDIVTLGSMLRQFVVRCGCKVVVIDYLQLLKSRSKAAMTNRYLEIGEITRFLKEIAKELGVVMIVGAQISRKAEERRGSRPQLSDLRESGDIEQDADVVLIVHRPFYYAQEQEKEDRDNDDIFVDALDGTRVQKANLIIAKNRGAATGEISLGFRPDIVRFESLTARLLSNNPDQRQH